MAFSIPHKLIDRLLPAASNVDPRDWSALVRRADQLNMERREYGTFENGKADEFEGTWLKKWSGDGYGQRLLPKEAAMVPLFHDLTRPLPELEIAKSGWSFPPVRWDAITGDHEGVDLQALARRIAETSLEALDGDDTKVALEAFADAQQAHTPREVEAMKMIMWRYFARQISFSALADRGNGISASFEAREAPYDLCKQEGTKAQYKFKRDVQKITINAPEGARVSVVPQDCHGRWSDRAFEADVGPGGQVTFDISNLPGHTAKLALYVVHDEDGAGPQMPIAKTRVSIPMPWTNYHHNIDNADRIERLKNRQPV